MKAHWWSCVLGLFLCMPAWVTLHTRTVSQRPMSIVVVRGKSSVEISCSTSFSDPIGLYLRRKFLGDRILLHLALEDGLVTKNTTAAEFRGQLNVTLERQVKVGYEFTMWLSELELDDTNLYYCTWSRFESEKRTLKNQTSIGTIIIVQETDPQEQCKDQMFVLTWIFLSVAVIVILFLVIGALIFRCKRFRKDFRPDSPQHVHPQQRVQNNPYLITSENTLDFRGIL
ncbi:uncharacterized protein LOC118101083 [Hippoglossus stenolepis]|uniref:uncharacterized protein LOC118101083 n=1 Tax=Hippoglossus stenolepis TaxID=195615 RepID=UPI00159C19F8|nr:uncharacterized protein LOC118101083 [Hippoglossus stenolepis]XP_035002624.1 uncharacterized protein LOC118101083 [Hippoglossus stenolepis]